MTAADARGAMETMLGDCCPIPAVNSTSTTEVFVSADVLRNLITHWKSFGHEMRPRLRGLTVSRAGSVPVNLQILLSPASKGPTILVSADVGKGKDIPALHEVWPYACWWESELRSFENINVKERPDRKENGGVSWRLS